MNLPFTAEQFLGVFRDYNLAVWPAQILALLLATWCIALALGGPTGSRLISALLATLWLWMGIVYHGVFFSRINPIAIGFGALFVVEAFLIVRAGILRRSLRFQARRDRAGVAGALLMAYGLLVYPVLGAAAGHGWPQTPSFGLPCPTTIFTLGMLLWSDSPTPRHLLVIPMLWSILGVSAALRLGVIEDIGLVVAALVAAVFLLPSRARGAAIVSH